MSQEKIDSILEALDELLEESTVPKNVKTKILSTKAALNEKTDISLRVNKALNELEELTDDVNLDSYTRTQLWNITSMLEMI